MLGLLVPLAGLLGIELESLGQRAKGLALGYAAILIFAMIGFGFLVAAGFIVMSGLYGPLTASMIMASVFLVFALVIFVGMSIADHARKKRMAERRRTSDTGAFLTTAALTALPLLVRSPALAKIGIPAAALAALALLRDKDTPST